MAAHWFSLAQLFSLVIQWWCSGVAVILFSLVSSFPLEVLSTGALFHTRHLFSLALLCLVPSGQVLGV